MRSPVGLVFPSEREKGLTIKTGQTHCHRYIPMLMEMVGKGRIDPSFVISHEIPLEEAPNGYRMFHSRQNECTKVVLKPH